MIKVCIHLYFFNFFTHVFVLQMLQTNYPSGTIKFYCTVLSVLYTVHCTLYTVHCTLYTVHCTLYTVHCTLFIVHCSLYTVHCTPYTTLQCTVLYCTVLYCTVLYCTVLYCTVLYCTTALVCYTSWVWFLKNYLLLKLNTHNYSQTFPNITVEGKQSALFRNYHFSEPQKIKLIHCLSSHGECCCFIQGWEFLQ